MPRHAPPPQVLLLAAALLVAAPAAAQDCKAMYRPGSKPLLFGGLGEPGRCVKNCQPRTSFW